MKISNIAALTAATALLAGCKEKSSAEQDLSKLKHPGGQAVAHPDSVGASVIKTPTVQRAISQLNALGYQVSLDSSTLLRNGDSQTAQAFKALRALGLAQYSSPDLEDFISKRYQKNFLTEANDLKPEHRVVTIPRFTADCRPSSITLTDNVSGGSFALELPLTEPQREAFGRFCRSLSPVIPSGSPERVRPTVLFGNSPGASVWNLPQGASATIDIYSKEVSVGSGGQRTGLIEWPLRDVASGREPRAIRGVIKSIQISAPSILTKAPDQMVDSFGNAYTFELYKDRVVEGAPGTIVINIRATIPDNPESGNAQAQTRIALSDLKKVVPSLEMMPDEISLLTDSPHYFEHAGTRFASLLAIDAEKDLDPKRLDQVLSAIKETERLFGQTERLVQSVLLTDGGLGRSNSYFSPHESKERIAISDTALGSEEAARNVARHETTHLIDSHHQISRSPGFLEIAETAYKQDGDLLDKIVLVGDHPKTSPEELFETLVNSALNFATIKNRLSPEESKRLLSVYSGVTRILNDKLPKGAPITGLMQKLAEGDR